MTNVALQQCYDWNRNRQVAQADDNSFFTETVEVVVDMVNAFGFVGVLLNLYYSKTVTLVIGRPSIRTDLDSTEPRSKATRSISSP